MEIALREVCYSTITHASDPFCVGDVMIAPTAVIAPGVVLRADPNCSITVRDGACLGVGVIVHATGGSIEIHQKVCVAGDVLIVGCGTLGRQACIGAGATLLNPAVAEAEIVPAQARIGDSSRGWDVPNLESPEPARSPRDVPSDPVDPPPSKVDPRGGRGAGDPSVNPLPDPVDGSSPPAPTSPTPPPAGGPPNAAKRVIGKAEFEKMVRQMFPDRQAFEEARHSPHS
ncbi:hypothetical protein [Lyngbya confervoides]|uniref:Transferase n=1 Tax=Lyngbya confervoides BDU141951 TaxID=1574623 RepID=A0ABD4T3H7_9CYAN|nr:hypothetical protein [Lyngbya confervoides]MCM1983044.1 hypothetical protein [Lyngbya confervoides BDU141951]